jgi:tetratricopeptide (TPR) repeat protein
VYYLHQALKIREDFLEWKRLAGLCRRRGFLDQAEFCLKKSVGMAPMLNKDIIYEELCETYILNKHQKEAINLADELIARGFRTARAKSLKLVAVRQLLSESTVQDFVRRRLKLDEDILLSEGTT